jgi:hypothetical protein
VSCSGGGESEYSADGVDVYDVKGRVDELLAPTRESLGVLTKDTTWGEWV